MEKENVVSSLISVMKTLMDNAKHPCLPDINQFLEKDSESLYNEISKLISKKYSITTIPSDSRLKFVTHASFLLLSLKDELESCNSSNPESFKENLVSLNEEEEIKHCLEICVSLSLLGALLPGIGIPLEKRSKFVSLIKIEQTVNIVENYDRLSYITKVLSQLINSNTLLKSIVISRHLGDYLSALFQLIYTPLLKPGRSNKDNTFTMTEEFYARLITERQQFKTMLSQLLGSVNQTDILKQVMILFGYCVQSGNKHVWFTNACTNILNQTLNKSNGIEILLKAMCDDDDYASPLMWKKLDIVARILATMKSSYDVTFPQILQMLQSADLSRSSDIQFARVSCKYVYQYDGDTFHTRIFVHIVAPLVNIEEHDPEQEIIENVEPNESEKPNIIENSNLKEKLNITENSKKKEKSYVKFDLVNCVIVLNRLFSHIEGLPRELLVKYANRLFFVYVNLAENPLFTPAKVPLESLLCTLFTSFPSEQCAFLLNKMIFQVGDLQCSDDSRTGEAEVLDEDDIEESVQENTGADTIKLVDGMLGFPPGSINISPTGSVSYFPPFRETQSVAVDYEKFGQCILTLLKKRQKKTASYNLFICLLNNYTRGLFKDDFARNVVNVKLLNDLLGNIQVGDFISLHPQYIIMLIDFLIKEASKGCHIDKTDTLCTGLTILNIIMSEQNAPLFMHIVPSLETLINESKNDEVLLLAKQCLEQIKAANFQKPRGSKKVESYEKAMCDACDPLLPVRAHGIATLTKLILSGDANAKANKSALLCLFIENLSDEDSYLYLSAVEGLAALASDHADSVVDTLTQHFMSQSRGLELRLKLGEVLMKVARHLGEMLVKHKTHFLNAFLYGCKDEDHLMRASSLSNLAEVCKLLGYRVGSILSEIFICIKCVISSDPYPEPRRAAVMVASFLLCGLKQEALQVLEPILPELYRTLRYIYDRDLDDRTRLHAQLALEQLNEAVKTFLTPSLPAGFATLRL